MATVELVRHAKARSRAEWNGGDDNDRPLSGPGLLQAQRMAADVLDEGDVAAIYSSPLTRCMQTCEPIARAGVTVLTDPRVGEIDHLAVADGGSAWVASAWLGGRALGLLDEVLRRHSTARVVVCSHGDVISALLSLLVGRDGVELSDVRVRKGGRVTLSFDAGGHCIRAVHLGRPRADVSHAAEGPGAPGLR